MDHSRVEPAIPEGLAFRPIVAGEESSVLKLLNTSLGDLGGVRSIDYWQWKHHQNPHGRSAVLGAVDHAGVLVGLRAFLSWKFGLEGQTISAWRCVDTAVHPDYRGRGVFSALTRSLISDLTAGTPAVIFNTPNDRSMSGYLKMGWERSGRTPLLVWPQPYRLIKNRFENQVSDLTDLISLPEALPEWLNEFRNFNHSLISTIYSHDYLIWRYCQVPGIKYGMSFESGDGFAMGVWRVKRTFGLRELRLVEIIHSGSGAPVQRLLLRLTKEIGPDVVTVMNDGAGLLGRLLPKGFIPAERFGLPITIRFLNDERLFRLFQNPALRNFSAGTMELF